MVELRLPVEEGEVEEFLAKVQAVVRVISQLVGAAGVLAAATAEAAALVLLEPVVYTVAVPLKELAAKVDQAEKAQSELFMVQGAHFLQPILGIYRKKE